MWKVKRHTVLVVCPFFPLPADFGGAIRTYHLIRELSRTCDVIVVAPAGRDEWPSVHQLGSICDVAAVPVHSLARHANTPSKRVRQLRSSLTRHSFLERASYSARMDAVISRLFMTRSIDLVQYEFTQTAVHQPPRSCPTVIDAHNIEHELTRRVALSSNSPVMMALKSMEARKVARLEERLWLGATVCVATSKRDASVIAQHTTHNPIVVPNGVDVAAFAPPTEHPRRKHHIVFTGVMRHQPNVDGLLWYLEHVHPIVQSVIPDVTLSLVGADPPPSIQRHASSVISVTGRVSDVRPYLHDATVAIVPLFAGGGTRLKIVESFASGVPVVSTSIGAEGIDARPGTDLLIADEPRQFAAKVIDLLIDTRIAEGVSVCARHRAAELFDWSIVVQPLRDAHERALQSSTG